MNVIRTRMLFYYVMLYESYFVRTISLLKKASRFYCFLWKKTSKSPKSKLELLFWNFIFDSTFLQIKTVKAILALIGISRRMRNCQMTGLPHQRNSRTESPNTGVSEICRKNMLMHHFFTHYFVCVYIILFSVWT